MIDRKSKTWKRTVITILLAVPGILTMFYAESAAPLPSTVKTIEINWFHLVATERDEVMIFVSRQQPDPIVES